MTGHLLYTNQRVVPSTPRQSHPHRQSPRQTRCQPPHSPSPAPLGLLQEGLSKHFGNERGPLLIVDMSQGSKEWTPPHKQATNTIPTYRAPLKTRPPPCLRPHTSAQRRAWSRGGRICDQAFQRPQRWRCCGGWGSGGMTMQGTSG